MKLKVLYLMAGLLAAGPTLADTQNGFDPYGAGFSTPNAASWGWWTRGAAGTLYAEFDNFIDSSYPGARTAAPSVGASGLSDAHIAWNPGVFMSGTQNLYSFSVDQAYTVALTPALPLAALPTRVVAQIETWSFPMASILLNGLAATSTTQTYQGVVDSPVGPASTFRFLNIWDLASAPSSLTFNIAAPKHTAFTQAAFDVSPVPEPGTYAMLLAGLGLVGAIARRRRQV